MESILGEQVYIWMLIGLNVLAAFLALHLHFKKKRNEKELREEGVTKILGATFSELRKFPAKMKDLRGKYVKVGVVSHESEPTGRYREVFTITESFLVDIANEIVSLEEARNEQAIVEENATWLAEQLGIPFEYQ